MLAVRVAQRTISGPAAVAGAKIVFSALTLAAYGFHRDELYLEQCGRHLAWGFVDHGPLVPALSFLASRVPGSWLIAARFLTSIAAAATVVTAAATVRLLGGAMLAQALAAALVATAPLFVYSGGVFGTNAFDQLFWTLAGFCAVRGTDRRWRICLGLCVGAGILAKPTMLLGAGCIFAVMLASRASRGVAIAIAVAAVIASPLAIWEHAHGWPGLAFVTSSRATMVTRSGPLALALEQVRLLGPLGCATAVAGVVVALRRGADARLRIAALPWLLAVAVVAVAGGKPYYAASAAPLAIAAGSIAFADRLRAFPRLGAAALVGSAIIQCGGALPLAPRLPLIASLHPDLVQFADWEALVASVERVRDASGLPADAPVLTDSYGTAAALQHYGGPPVLSGSNAFAAWAWERTAEEPEAVIAIGYPPALLRRFFARVEPAGRVHASGDNRYDFPREAWRCTGRIASLRDDWAAFRRFD